MIGRGQIDVQNLIDWEKKGKKEKYRNRNNLTEYELETWQVELLEYILYNVLIVRCVFLYSQLFQHWI